MAGHPSVKKRQKELQRRERQAEKATKRDERKKGSPAEGSGGGEIFESEVVFDADGNATIIQAPAEHGDGPPNDAGRGPAAATSE